VVSLPKLKIPKLKVPKFKVPKLNKASFDLRKLPLPQVLRKQLDNPVKRRVASVLAVLLIVGALFFSLGGGLGRPSSNGPGGPGSHGPDVVWADQLDLNAVGYEPGIAADSTGALFITAHKNLDVKSSWPYLASWFLMSTDNGQTWKSPNQPPVVGNYWKTFLGDEGDIGVDASDYVYFIDTYLIDNHIHIFKNQGVWDHSVRIQKSSGLDDRPWIAAQGSGILHYLGNNGQVVAGGRYWYYRSANQGLTWTKGDPVPGNGWAHIDAERNGDHVYVVDESDTGAPADIRVWVSENRGQTWDWSNPVIIAHRDGPGREYPTVTSGEGGLVYVLWNDATDGETNGTRIFAAVSDDFGKTWNTTEITPFRGFIDYPSINAGPDGRLAVAFYGTTDLPVSDNSTWYLYGAMARHAPFGQISLNFSRASEEPLYTGSDLHALHDFFEIVITPDGALNIGFQHYVGPCNGCSELYFIRGELPPSANEP
jgi:hypothetical protein